MATNTLPVPMRLANPAISAASSGLSKTTARAVDMARLHLHDRNPGAYALASDNRIWFVVAECPADELTSVMAQIVGHPDRQDAVRTVIERRQNGELV